MPIDGSLRQGQFIAPAIDVDTGRPVGSRLVGETLALILNANSNEIVGLAEIRETSGGRAFVRGTLNLEISRGRELAALLRQTGVTFYTTVRTRQPRSVSISAFGDVGAVEQVG